MVESQAEETEAPDVEEEDLPPFQGIARFPCDTMMGTVLVREPGSFRKVHVLAMKFLIQDGTISGLLGAFGLGPQVMQEVLADLVFGEAVRMDLDNDIAIVCEPFATLISQSKTEELEARLYRTREVKVTWLLDRSTGEVFAERELGRYTDPPSASSASLDPRGMAQEVPELKKTANTVLARAALPVLQEILGEDDMDLSRIEQIESKKKLPGNTLYVPVKGVRLPGSTQEYYVPEAPGVPPAVREAWTKLLNQGRSTSDLIAVLAPEEELAPSPASLANELEVTLRELQSLVKHDITSASIAERIDVLMLRLKKAFQTADDMERSVGTTSVAVGDRKVQLDFLSEFVKPASKRVIICSAFSSEAGFESLFPRLQEIAKRSVKITLIQGLSGDEDGPAADEARDRARFEAAAGSLDATTRDAITFYKSRRPFHAKVVLVDNARICLSSHNWMSGLGEGGPREISVATDASLAVARLGASILEWLPPDSLEAVELGEGMRRKRARETRVHFFKKSQETIQRAWSGYFQERSPVARALIEGQLNEGLAKAKLVRSLTPCLPVFDGEHRGQLFRMIDAATKTVHVASDGVSDDAAGGRFGAAISAAVARGASVNLVWGRQTRVDDQGARNAKAVERLRANLSDSARAKVVLPATPSGNHAKAVVSDSKEALISSFNFLSFGATERPGVTFSTELGLLVFDPTCISKAASLFAQR